MIITLLIVMLSTEEFSKNLYCQVFDIQVLFSELRFTRIAQNVKIIFVSKITHLKWSFGLIKISRR